MGEEDGRPQTAGREAPSPSRINVERDKLAVWKKGLSIAQSVAAIIAILTAGLWFFLRGEAFERANITQAASMRR